MVLNGPLVVQLDHLRTGPDDKLKVVRDHKHDHAGSGQLLNQAADPHHGVIVQAAGGLVKIDHWAVLDDGRANGDPLFLPAGEGRRVLFPVFGQLQRLQRGVHLLFAVLPNPKREFFLHTAGKELVIRVLHDQIGQRPALAWGELSAVKGDLAVPLLQEAGQDGQEGGLARSVVAQDADHIPGVGFKADIPKDLLLFRISKGKALHTQQVFPHWAAFFFLIMLRIPLRICSPQPIGYARSLR